MRNVHLLGTAALALLVCVWAVGCSDTNPTSLQGPENSALVKAGAGASSGSISEQEAADILYIREEEKLARDIYDVMYERWKKPVFDKISASEEIHMEAMYTLIDRYGLTDPVGENLPGVFTNASLQALYLQLEAKGLISLEEALAVGVEIEETDIADLQAAMEAADNQDIDRTYENLLKGSVNHLAAFNRHLPTP